jgi:hypothetical protein
LRTSAGSRRRDLQLSLAGWRVIRLSWRQLLYQRESVVTLLRSII